MGKVTRSYGWRRDLPHIGDARYSRAPGLRALGGTPPVVDLSGQMPPIYDQGATSSCTGNGTAAVYGHIELKELAAGISAPQVFVPGQYVDPSRLMIYWNGRAAEGATGEDGGAQIRDCVQSLKKIGVCRETTWPFDPSLVLKSPSRAAFAEASAHKELLSYRVDNTSEEALIACLAEGFPIVFGATLYRSFESDAVAANGIVPMPRAGEPMVGGHCMAIVGYDIPNKLFKVRNSWGLGWGICGYCQFPAGYITNGDLVSDSWTLRIEASARRGEMAA